MSKRPSLLRTFTAALALGGAAAAAYVYWVRPRILRWGLTDEEFTHSYPGDELVPHPKLCSTHAVTINAAREKVWPWLVQIGQGRGGFYSYDFIENLMGLDIHTADRIIPEFQEVKPGERIPLAPGGFGVPVEMVAPARMLVLHGDTRLDPGTIPVSSPDEFFNVTWAFYLEPCTGNRTRLIERWRADWNPGLKTEAFMRAFLEPGAFVMSRKMLLGIKQHAEGKAQITDEIVLEG